MFIAKFNLKISERDNFENGCDPFNSNTRIINIEFESSDLSTLLREICKYFNVRIDSVLLNSCDELGRIDVQTYTKTLKGNKCSYDQYADGFKLGNYDLFLNCFIGRVTTLPAPVDLCDRSHFIIK